MRHETETITVGVGDCRISGDPGALLVTHALGSCIAVAMHDPAASIGGLLHFLLPEASLNSGRASAEPYLFADTGIPALFQEMIAHGAQRSRLSVWLVGGAQVMDPNGVFNIGLRNYQASRKILDGAGMAVADEAVGGSISRTVRLHVGSGGLEWNSCGGEWFRLQRRLA